MRNARFLIAASLLLLVTLALTGCAHHRHRGYRSDPYECREVYVSGPTHHHGHGSHGHAGGYGRGHGGGYGR